VSPVVTTGTSELTNVIIFVDAPATPSAPMHAAINQTDEVFIPHTTAVTVGSTVEFPNDDMVFHNVFSLSRAASFDLGHYPQGTSKRRTFTKPGVIKVYCHLHSHMSAIVRVFDHPFFAVPETDGRFTIDGLTPGSYDVIAWHERVGDVTLRAEVRTGATSELSFSLPLLDDQ
jgi:plastocyanin